MVVTKDGPKRQSWKSLGLDRPVPPGLWPVGSPMPPVDTLLREMAQEREWLLVESIVSRLKAEDE